jgi:hypothetical protein
MPIVLDGTTEQPVLSPGGRGVGHDSFEFDTNEY